MLKLPNFFNLSEKYPALKECIINTSAAHSSLSHSVLDWNDQKTLRTLTTVILKDEFDINIVLPSDRLCPPVPNRLSYITWLAQILDLSQQYQPDDQKSKSSRTVNEEHCILPLCTVVGLDPSKPAGTNRSSLFSGNLTDVARMGENRSSSDMSSYSNYPASSQHLEACDAKKHHILDIGVGASCIYPLLGHSKFKWR